MKTDFRHVLVLFGPRYNHIFHRGIAAYARQTRWHLSVLVHTGSEPLPAMKSVDGVLIADDFPAHVLKPLLDSGMPGVSLLARSDGLGVAQVIGDNVEIGRLAGEHFRERGFKNYAYLGPSDSLWGNRRRDGFRDTVAEVASTFAEIHLMPTLGRSPLDWLTEKRTLVAQLEALPRPCALFCVSDPLACRVLDVCLELGLKVPEEVAILGVDDDPLYCESVAVPLSSVRHDVESVGFCAAQHLERMMNGERVVPSGAVAPLGIAVRRSTDHYAAEHPAVLAALSFIDEHHARNIGVADVAAAANLPLRTLQHLFRAELHESVVERLTRTRFAKAKEWLTRSSVPISTVARQAGFASSGYFHRIFKTRQGCTPVAFRKIMQAEGKQGLSEFGSR